MKNRVLPILIAILIGIVALVGCMEEDISVPGEQPQTEQQTTVTETDKQGTIVDPSGKTVIIPDEVSQIVSLAPSITQILIDLGYGDKIIGADQLSANIEGVTPAIPSFDMMAPNIEEIATLQPDIIFTTNLSFKGDTEQMGVFENFEISVAAVPTPETIEGIKGDIKFISTMIGAEEKGQHLIDEMEKEIAEIEKIGASIEDKKTILFEIANAPNIYSFGNGVYLNEMIEIIGAENILKDQQGWLPVEVESAIIANPDVILTNVNYIENPEQEILSREGWGNVTAIVNQEVAYIDNFSSSLPNHNIVKALKSMAKEVYPDVYEDMP